MVTVSNPFDRPKGSNDDPELGALEGRLSALRSIKPLKKQRLQGQSTEAWDTDCATMQTRRSFLSLLAAISGLARARS